MDEYASNTNLNDSNNNNLNNNKTALEILEGKSEDFIQATLGEDEVESSSTRARAEARNGEHDFSFSIGIVGDAGVGKSSLLNWELYEKIRFDFGSDVGSNAIKFHFKTYNLYGYNHRVKFLDVTGSDEHMQLSARLISTAAAIIYVFDVNRPNTMHHLEDWIKAIDNFNVLPRVIIGNMNDRSQHDPDVRKVSVDDAGQFAKKMSAQYFDCSAITGEGINDAFAAAVMEVVAKITKSDIPNPVELLQSNVHATGKLSALDKIRIDRALFQNFIANLDITTEMDWL